jgi:hypothetical protein
MNKARERERERERERREREGRQDFKGASSILFGLHTVTTDTHARESLPS